MSQLRADILQIPRADDAPEFLGLGSVDASGVLQLGSDGATAAALEALALWTATHIAAHPGLARLRNTRMLRIDGNRIAAIHQADALWSAIPELVLSGTMAQSAQTLAGLDNSAEAWFWLSAEGPDGLPWIALAPRQQPAADFAQTIRSLILRSPSGVAGIKGVGRMLAGRLMLTTADDITGWQDAIAALQIHRIPRLTEVGMLQIVRGRIKAAEAWGSPSPSVDLSAQSAVLSGLAVGERVWFWFAADGATGPTLLLATDRADLKPLIKATRATGAVCKGQLRRSKKGWLEFITRDETTDFIPRLAGFVATHRSAWPKLAGLIGARMTRRDADGNVLDRIKDDRAWQ
ncbi:MAG: hypothetical protein ACI8RZ_001360 [Myxococcota bacterium]|jgi:hypothetical protein